MKPFYLLAVILISLNQSLSAQKLPPSIVWQKCLGGTNDEYGQSIIKGIDGGFIAVGWTHSNDGDLTGHYGSADNADAWVVKLSATGEIEWQRNYGGSLHDAFNTIIPTSDGNYICFGITSSNDGDVSGLHGKQDWWVVKIDRNGNIIWQKALGGTRDDAPANLRQFSDGSIYLTGTTSSDDGNVSGNMADGGQTDVWVVKLSLSGSIIWQKAYGGDAADIGYDIAESNNGTFIITVYSSSITGDFGPVPFGPMMGVIAKIDPTNGIIWRNFQPRSRPVSLMPAGDGEYRVTFDYLNCFPNHPNAGLRSVTLKELPSGNNFQSINREAFLGFCPDPPVDAFGYYMGGPKCYTKLPTVDHIYVGTYDTVKNDPTRIHSQHGLADGFVAGYFNNSDTSVSLGWKKFIGGDNEDYFYNVEPISESELIVVGFTRSNNDDVRGNHGKADMWVVKLRLTNLIKGIVFIDRNSNGTKENDEPVANDILVESKKAGQTVASNTSEGLFVNAVDTGTYVTGPIVTSPYYTVVPATRNSSFNTYNNSDTLVFALQPVPGKRDYRLQIFTPRPGRPGFDMQYNLRYENIGTDTFATKNVWFVKDSRTTFVSADPAATSVSGDTIRWNIASLLPADSALITVKTKIASPPAVKIGDTLNVSALIDSSGDLVTANNYDILSHRIVGSYDPNDKLEMHEGVITQTDLNNGKPLVYVIRFQNTGTDTAFNIVIRDTLDAKLDWNSLEMVGASHPYTLSVKNGNILTWTFADVLLVDSNHNEPASHGYIAYRIKVKPGWTLGDKIKNTASIYFDFNLPVVTNIAETTISNDPPATPTVTGIQTTYCSTAGIISAKIMNLPATGSGVTVAVKIDNNTVTVGADSTFSFNVSTLSAGAHNITVQYSNATANRINSTGFTITTAVNPNVDVSSNITTITNLATNVIVSAMNNAGGGTTPMYTFARNRTFTDIAQAESVNNTWTFSPTLLSIGDNKIYVRMKSNAACVVTNTVIDSILLVRSSVTGITDPDMPGQVINIYPNPFKDAITITGLSTAKIYSIKLFNLEGKQLVSKRVSGRTSIVLTRQQHANGIYWLSIYDDKRKQLLGTVKMLKD